jgi:mannose-1-phosphate guanylyltransferase
MRHMANAFAVVLAGGDGERLRSLTTTREGLVVPKQYCSLGRADCLLQDAVARARALVTATHVCSVVAAQHRRWWRPALANVNDANVFVQPQNRGTGLGILLALLRLRRVNPAAVVTLLPADHYFRDEALVIRALRAAANLATEHAASIYVLGTDPEAPDQELGYILPAERVRGTAVDVVGFAEKPSLAYARELMGLGALWNLFILVGSVGALLELFAESYARPLELMQAALDEEAAGEAGALAALYATLAPIDFSRDVLELQANRLQVMRVPNCGWTDLGTPQRVEATVRRLVARTPAAPRPVHAPAPMFFDLCMAS